MWELISSNRRKSAILFALMGLCLIVIGYLIGEYYASGGGGIFGIVFATALWLLLSALAYFEGDSIFLSMSGAKEVTRESHPQLFNVVEEMKIASGLPVMPRVYIIDEDAMNAFAVGRNPQKCAIAVTAGLVARLNRDELQGVIAHEMSHIVNRDSLYMIYAGVTLGAIALLSNLFWHGNRWGGMRYRYKSSRGGGGGAQIIILLVTVIFVLLGAFMARLLYFAISRRREYLADASAVRLTRYPEGLASALEKISSDVTPLVAANKVTAPLYIVNPLSGDGAAKLDWESTHPPIQERIKILRSLSSGAGYLNYEDAYSRVKGPGARLLPKSALSEKKAVPIRQPDTTLATISAPDKKSSQRALGDLIMNMNNYLFINCACGLTIKVPPDLKQPEISCPRCGHIYPISGVAK